MNTNKLLTYLLYALLAGLVLVFGYKTCQMQRDDARAAEEQRDAEFQKSLRDFGYIEDDTTGSAFTDEDSNFTEPPATSPAPGAKTSPKSGGNPASTGSGIEDEDPKPLSLPPSGNTAKPSPGAKTGAAAPTTAPAPKPGSSDRYADGRYRVVAGSFTVMDGARREMERLIKMGYHDAEIGRYNRGKYAVVIVKRTNSLDEANRIVDQLERRGIDAAVVDRERQ